MYDCDSSDRSWAIMALLLFHCDKHNSLRSDLMQNLHALCSVNSTEIDKLKYLLTHDHLISKTGHFIINALKNRN